MSTLKIQKFGGRVDENVEQFLSSVKIVVDLEAEERTKTMSSQVRAYYIQSHLEDKAARFVAHLPNEVVSDWDLLSKALKDKYRNNAADEASRRQAQDALLELRQEPGISLEVYYKQVKKIAKGLRPEDEHYATSKFVKGLAKKRLRTHATTAIPYGSSLDEAISIVKHLVPVICPDLSAKDEQSGNDEDTDNSDDSDESEEEDFRKIRRRRSVKKRARKPGKKGAEDSVSKFEFMKEVEGLRALLRESLKSQVNVTAATSPVPPAVPQLVDTFAVNRLAQPQASYTPYQPQGYVGQNFGAQFGGPPGRQFPGPGFQNGFQRPPRDRSTITCFSCGQLGHYRSECPAAQANGGAQYYGGPVQGQFPNQGRYPNQGQPGQGQFCSVGQFGGPPPRAIWRPRILWEPGRHGRPAGQSGTAAPGRWSNSGDSPIRWRHPTATHGCRS